MVGVHGKRMTDIESVTSALEAVRRDDREYINGLGRGCLGGRVAIVIIIGVPKD